MDTATRKELRDRITELEEQNEELLDVIENISSLTKDVVEEEEEGSDENDEDS